MKTNAIKLLKDIPNNSQYQNKYVAFASSGKKRIIASSANLGTVIKKARLLGEKVPAIVFVPKKGTMYLY